MESTDIHNYLNSFNKEIQDVGATQVANAEDSNKQNEGYSANASLTEGTKVQLVDGQQGIFAGATFFAAADGTLYSTATGQSNIGQQIAFLAPGSGHFQDNGSGLQQILLAVGDGSAITSIDPKALSLSVPVQLSNQISSGKQNLSTSDTKRLNEETKNLEADIGSISIAENGATKKNVSLENNSKPQTVMLLQQSGQELVNQMIPITTNSQAIIAGLGGGELQVNEQQTLQMVASIAEQASNSGNSAVISNGSSYQTVTIVPSDTNPGEVSYVLFMSSPKENDQKEDDDEVVVEEDENLNLSVYDFNDGEKIPREYVTVTGEDGIRTIRISHKRSQIVTQQHMCNYCNYTSPKRYLLSRHMKSHSDERPHKCSVCERGFKTLASLQNHVNTHTGTRPHACKDCDSCFTTSGELVRHVRYKHTHEKPHHCTECDYASVELSKLKRHMRCHTGERPYQCPHCTYASPDTYKLKRHLRIHTGEKPYECNVCQSRFTQSNSLKAHKLIHSGNKPMFKCQYCPTTCGRRTDLRIHIQKLHSNDKIHRCKRCGKIFEDRYNFKMHSKSHEGEKCFKCDLCSYASVTLKHLEAHMLIHTDQKPYRCEICDQCFRQKQLLKRHVNLYHDPSYVPPVPKEKNLSCSDCGKAFRHKGNLIRHLAVHDPDATVAEREEAMQIGRPKEPGEICDGEEDDISDYVEMDYGNEDNKQVVVFEVIQLAGNGSGSGTQTLTAANGETFTLDTNGSQAFTIIQQASDNEKGNEATFCELTNVASGISNHEMKLVVKEEPVLYGDEECSGETQHSNDDDDMTEFRNDEGLTNHVAHSEDVYRPPQIIQIPAESKSSKSQSCGSVFSSRDEKIQEHIEKQMNQKQKDIEECFGFSSNHEDDEDEHSLQE